MKKIKKLIIGLILGLFLGFGIFASSVKTKATIITLTPIVDINDIPNGAKIIFNQTLTNFSTQFWAMAETFATGGGNGTGFYYNTTSWNKGQIVFNKTSGIYFRGSQIYDWTHGWTSSFSARTFYVSAEQINFYNSQGQIIDSTNTEFINWINANTTITYEVIENPITINLNANGGYFVDSGTGDELQTKTIIFYGSQTTTSEAITNALIGSSLEYPNHTFLGWGTSSSSATTLTTSELNALPTGTTIYAIWRDDNYITIYYEKNPNLPMANYTGATPSAQNVLKNSTYTPLGNTGSLAYPHYHFIGWNTDEYATTGLSSIEVATSNITLYSIFEIDTHTLTLNLQGGNIPGGITSYTYNYNTQVSLNQFNTPVKVGFVFLGWGLTSDATEFISQITMTSNKTIYAIWGTFTQDLATITFNSNDATGGAVPGSIQVIKGQQYTLPSNPGELVRVGYTFIGWGLTSDATTPVYTITPSANMTLYAIWNELNYATVYLQVNGQPVATTRIYNGLDPTFYVRFNEFNNDYFYIQITAYDGVNYSNVDYNYIWNIIYNSTDKYGRALYTFNGSNIEKIIITTPRATTEYDQASIDLAHYSILYYYNNNDVYTINILTEPNTELNSFNNIVSSIFNGAQTLLNIKVGWFSLGSLVAVVLAIGVLFFVIRVGKGGSSD